jgi:threonine/homoserine/homoserine lactone efflux protein
VENPLLYLLVGFLACLIGTIPFGPIDLTVVETTVDFDAKRGLKVALAASINEVFQALIAIYFGMLISNFLETNAVIKLAIALVFIGLAIFVFTRKTQPSLNAVTNKQLSFFKKGLLIAGLNPQAIPFWVIALAAISQYFVFDYSGFYLFAFLVGVFAGKITALCGFVIASSYLKVHLKECSQLVNRLLATILLFIGMTQGWNAASTLITQSV